MSGLHFIFGHAGSGKTYTAERILLRVANEGGKGYLLVPEQEAYIAERNFLSRLPDGIGNRITVLSFSRLANAVFSRFGGITAAKLDKGTKKLLMWQTLRSLSGGLHTYRGGSDTALAGLMLEAAEELRNSGISPAALEEAAAQLSGAPVLADKLTDLALICSGYDALVCDRFGGQPAEILTQLAESLKKHDFFGGSTVVVDSFTSFTAPERRVLCEILRQSDCVNVTLGILGLHDPGIAYDSLRDTASKLRLCADRLGIPVTQTVLADAGRNRVSVLRALSESLWQFDAPPIPFTAEDREHLRLIRAPHIYAEAEAAALEVLRLKKEGIDFGEIAIITRDPQTRRGILDAALERLHIPYFLSERTDLCAHPAARLLLSAMRAVTRHWQAEDLLTLLKTGLCGVAPEEIDLFEGYCNTWHLNGKAFEEETWNMNPDGYTTSRSARAAGILNAANRVRKQLMTPLRTLASELRLCANMRDKCAALYRYTDTIGLSGQLAQMAGAELERGQTRRAGELLRLYDALTNTLVLLADLLGEEQVSDEEFSAALSLLLSNTDIGSVPAMHDCVVIGSAATLRVENIRAVIAVGLTEGDFPGTVSHHGLFSANDRRLLTQMSLELGESEDSASSDELFYVYRAFSKPTETLVLMFPANRPDGKPCTPGTAFMRVRALFPEMPVTDFVSPVPAEALPHPEAVHDLTPETAGHLLGDTLRLSQTTLHTFVSCPYRFYCETILKLRAQSEARLGVNTAGSFIHSILEHYLRAVQLPDGSLCRPGQEESEQLLNRLIRDYIQKLCGQTPETLAPRLSHQFLRLRQLTNVLLCSILDEFSESDFRPVAFEQSFGQANDPLTAPSVTLSADTGIKNILFCGKIDRIDRWQDAGTTYLRVVDYKTGEMRFSTDNYRDDCDFQLPIYLFTATSPENTPYFGNGQQVLPAGALYLYTGEKEGLPVAGRSGVLLADDHVLRAMSHTEDPGVLCGIRKKRDGTYTGNLLGEDEMLAMRETVFETIRTIGNRIYSGCAQRTPGKDNCRYCSLADRCPVAVKSEF